MKRETNRSNESFVQPFVTEEEPVGFQLDQADMISSGSSVLKGHDLTESQVDHRVSRRMMGNQEKRSRQRGVYTPQG